MERIRKFLQLSWADKILLIQVSFMLAIVTLGLRIIPWLTLQRYLLRFAEQRSRAASLRRPSAQHIAWAIRTSSRVIPKATCLPQALVVQFLLVWNAYPADLQIGVAKSESRRLEAHAWVTSENQIIIGNVRDADRFVPLSPKGGQTIKDYGSSL